eukprot:1211328-Rhodomonas_salina.1
MQSARGLVKAHVRGQKSRARPGQMHMPHTTSPPRVRPLPDLPEQSSVVTHHCLDRGLWCVAVLIAAMGRRDAGRGGGGGGGA